MSGLRYKGVKLLGKANGRIMYLRASNYPLHFPIINRREQAGYYNIIKYVYKRRKYTSEHYDRRIFTQGMPGCKDIGRGTTLICP